MSVLNTKLTAIANLATNLDTFVATATDTQLLKTGARAGKLYRYFAARFGSSPVLKQLALIGAACADEHCARAAVERKLAMQRLTRAEWVTLIDDEQYA
jgi:hypothetical protein